MRAPERLLPKETEAVPPPPSVAAVALNRMAFGPRPGDLDAFNALGSTDEERLTNYVEQQLYPQQLNDSEAEARLTAAGLVTLNMSVEQLWANYVRGSGDRYRPFYEVRSATFLRAVYSRRQLLEVLTSFWHNHFNVYGRDYWVAPVFPHYDRAVIRDHVFGNFREMLEAVATSTAMLYYLDNYTSSSAGPNENFSRELFELHTMGAENYLGILQQSQVPLDPEGRPVAYVDPDVFESTRCFTGWSVNNTTATGDTGAFLYRPDWHDRFQKTVLGVFIPQDQPDLKDGRDVLDALAHHPGTARHIARKLCRRLIADDPPQEVIDLAAATFSDNADSPQQLRRVVRAILMSDAFRSTWGEKVKTPFELAASALRATEGDFHFAYDHDDTDSFFYRFWDAGQPLYEWPAPDGYPDSRTKWQSASSRIMSWRFVNWLTDFRDAGGNLYLDLLGLTPPSVRSANQLADFWTQRILGYPMPAAERQEIVDFMAQGHNPDLALPVDSDPDTRDRVRSMVGLILMSPSFMWR
jgi:uncharacterized protein (DUF1800 family)